MRPQTCVHLYDTISKYETQEENKKENAIFFNVLESRAYNRR